MFSKPISDSTKRQHASILAVLESKGQIERVDGNIVLHKTLLEFLKLEIGNPNTRKNYLGAVLRAATTTPPEELKPYVDLYKTTTDWLRGQRVSQTLPHHRLENMLKWSEVLQLRGKAETDLSGEDLLTYFLYTLNPPVRADYANMLVVKSWSKTRRADTTRNYLVWHDDHAYFVFNVFKTSKTYGQVKVDVSDELYAALQGRIVIGSLLLPSTKTPTMLSKRVISVMQKLCGKQMGIGLLRHSYITTFLSNRVRLIEKMALAHSMMHSWTQQEEYHIIENDTDGDAA